MHIIHTDSMYDVHVFPDQDKHQCRQIFTFCANPTSDLNRAVSFTNHYTLKAVIRQEQKDFLQILTPSL